MEDYRDPLILQSLEGAEAARLLTIATFALLVYEWFITLDSEIQCFWRGGWSKSRMLFLAVSPHIESSYATKSDLAVESVYDADHHFISVVLQVLCYDIITRF
ncbi:hypothetical protein PTI98_000579 [Pleurotus ostreatus]|nr:hypothetical protein PTI98_000579 [Pleurotus ostreatus]